MCPTSVPAPRWMREGLRDPRRRPTPAGAGQAATAGCSHVIHLASRRRRAPAPASAAAHAAGGTTTHSTTRSFARPSSATWSASTYVSSALVFERATEFPTPEAHLPNARHRCRPRASPELTGEVYCRAAHDEHGLQYTICRPCDAVRSRRRPRGGERAPSTRARRPDRGVARRPRPLRRRLRASRRTRHPRRRRRRRGSSRRSARRRAATRTSTSPPRASSPSRSSRAIVWASCGEDPPTSSRSRPRRRASAVSATAAGPRSRRPASCSAGRHESARGRDRGDRGVDSRRARGALP